MFDRMRRDHLAGLIVALIGLGCLSQAVQYNMGTMAHVGPGFMPVVLGTILTMIGAGIALTAGRPGTPEGDAIHTGPDLRGFACIAASVLLFAGLSRSTGLVSAIFACVLVAALGDRTMRVRSALLLASGMTLFGVLVFHYGLAIQIPLFQGAG